MRTPDAMVAAGLVLRAPAPHGVLTSGCQPVRVSIALFGAGALACLRIDRPATRAGRSVLARSMLHCGNIVARRALSTRRIASGSHLEGLMPASRNLLVALVVVLVAGLAATGYALYQEKKQPEGVEISVGKNGLSIKEK